jgi:hypothetical protein
MDLIPGKGMVPEGVALAEAFQSGLGSSGFSRSRLVQNRFKTSDDQITHGRLLFGGGNFHAFQEWVWQIDGGSHG